MRCKRNDRARPSGGASLLSGSNRNAILLRYAAENGEYLSQRTWGGIAHRAARCTRPSAPPNPEVAAADLIWSASHVFCIGIGNVLSGGLGAAGGGGTAVPTGLSANWRIHTDWVTIADRGTSLRARAPTGRAYFERVSVTERRRIEPCPLLLGPL